MTTVFERRYERRDTAANWSAANPILASGEWGYDTTNKTVKVGDGATAWNSLSGLSVFTVDGTSISLVASVLARMALTGDVTAAAGSGVTTLANVGPGATGPLGSATTVPVVTINAKGLVTGLTSATILIPESAVTNLVSDLALKAPLASPALTGTPTAPTQSAADNSTKVATTAYADTALALKAPTARLINTTAPITGGGDLTADRTIAITAASTSAAGSMSANDKLKADDLWIDVTATSLGAVTTAQTATQNITGINAILSGAANGSTIYFPPGRYDFNAAWTMPNKMFTFVGRGQNRAGSPATAFTELRWTSNVAASLIVLPGSGNGWYTTFNNLTFTTSVDQTVGTLIDANGNVGVNFHQVAVQSNGGFFLDVITYGGGAGSNSGNSTVIDQCNIQGFKGNGVLVNSAGSSLVISESVIQGLWGTATQAATACVRGKWVGALQIIGCDILGAVNDLLLDPTAASSEVCASVHCTNTYFDNALGSCIKVAGTGSTVRCKWDACTFTTSSGSTAFSAVELAGSQTYAAGGQDLQFNNCNIYNTFGTTGTTNGVLITNAADVSFNNCNVAGWTNGYNITPMASNKTFPSIRGGTVGPSGGQALNTTGFNIAAGAYKGLVIRGVNALGNTTNLTLGAVTLVSAAEAANFAITDNPGINPKGAVTTPAVGASTVAVTNTTGFRVTAYVRNGATAPTAWTVNGVVVTAFVSSAVSPTSNTFVIDPGGTLAFTYTIVPTWVWVAN